MTGTDTQDPGDPGDGPLSVELLADLHAGVLDEHLAAELRRRVVTDPGAEAVLAALDTTVADLGTWPQRCPARMPDEVALRLDAVLAETAQAAGRVTGTTRVDLTPAVGFTDRRRRWLAGIGIGLLGAAAAVMAVVAMSGVQWETPGNPSAADALGTATGVHQAPPPALTRITLDGALDETLGSRDYGPLAAPQRLSACLEANGAAQDSTPMGAREVTMDGRPGVLMVLTTGRLAEFRLLVVGPDCGPDNPARLADSVVGGR